MIEAYCGSFNRRSSCLYAFIFFIDINMYISVFMFKIMNTNSTVNNPAKGFLQVLLGWLNSFFTSSFNLMGVI